MIFTVERHIDPLRRVLPRNAIVVRNRRELFGATFTPGAVAFVDYELLEVIDGARIGVPVVALIDTVPGEALPATIRALAEFPWLSHVVQVQLLAMDRARAYFARLLERLTSTDEPLLISMHAKGRTALIAESSMRTPRLERMVQFFAGQDVTERAQMSLVDIGEELVMNALYNAPTEARFFAAARSRIESVELPVDRACRISYGVEGGNLFVRVRDTFGMLTRQRLLDALSRCSGEDVQLDGSRGGAGLGLWRVFANASAIAIRVVTGTVTDITVAVGKQDSRRMVRPLSVELYFAEAAAAWTHSLPGDDQFLVDRSFTMLRDDRSLTPSVH